MQRAMIVVVVMVMITMVVLVNSVLGTACGLNACPCSLLSARARKTTREQSTRNSRWRSRMRRGEVDGHHPWG